MEELVWYREWVLAASQYHPRRTGPACPVERSSKQPALRPGKTGETSVLQVMNADLRLLPWICRKRAVYRRTCTSWAGLKDDSQSFSFAPPRCGEARNLRPSVVASQEEFATGPEAGCSSCPCIAWAEIPAATTE